MQKFSSPGEVTYQILPSSACGPDHDEHQFTIEVRSRESKDQEGNQHHVRVERRAGKLVAEPQRVVIAPGDVVIWNTQDSSIPGYVVRGTGGARKFGSDALESGSVYTHAFGLPGEYHWVDPQGGSAQGVVEVKPVDGCDDNAAARWREKLGEGVVIVVNGKKASPAKVKILVGQTVFWAIEKASGAAITDARLVSKTFASAKGR